MGTTPVYSFPYPASTDYVYNGPTNFSDLATAVENVIKSLPVRTSDLIINGSFRVAQRATSVAGLTGVTASIQTSDRWGLNWGTNYGTWTQAQESIITNLPAGSFGALSMTNTVLGSIGANTAFYLYQRIEEANCQDLQKGLATAQKATLSFSVKSSKTGTFVATLWDQRNSVYQSVAYTINAANTWETKTITFNEDTTGTPFKNDTSTYGLELRFWMAAGTAFKSASIPNTWSADTTRMAFGQTSVGSTLGDTFLISNVQLVPGSQPKNWVSRPIDELLAQCQRYYHRINYSGTATYDVAHGRAENNSNGFYVIPFPTTMRIAPTALSTSGVTTHYQYVTGNTATNVSSIVFAGAHPTSAVVQVGGTFTANMAIGLRMNNTAAYLAWSAEF